MLYESCGVNLVRDHIRQLDPVLEEGIRHPVHVFVATGASQLLACVLRLFLALIKLSLNDPVVFLSSVDLSPESKLSSSRHQGKLFHAFLQLIYFLFSEVNSGPLEHASFLNDIWHVELSVFAG